MVEQECLDRSIWQAQKVLLALPVYNEERFLSELFRGLRSFVPKENTLIINDGSRDRSLNIIDAFQLPCITHEMNHGKGYSLLSAIAYAQKRNFSWLICMDSDGQHAPEELPRFLHAIAHHPADIILGCRQQRKGSMPFSRQLSNSLSSLLLSLWIGKRRLHDTQCGYRALRLAMINVDHYHETGFQFESELLLRLGKTARIVEIPISTRYGAEKSKIHVVKDSLRFLWLLIRYLWLYS